MSFYNFEENENPAVADEHFMRLALNEAKKAFDKDEIPIGSINSLSR
jgi:tRNA(adenine34) deaminase